MATELVVSTVSRTDEAAGSSFAGLSSSVIWLIVGLGIALLLVVIGLLLVIIACLHCSRRKVKGDYLGLEEITPTEITAACLPV